jgi:hypothetical protein
MLDAKNIFLFVYLAVDIAYVMASRGYYGEVVQRIQGGPVVMKANGLFVAGLSYAMLGLGWWLLVASSVKAESGYREVVFRAVVYALAVYGVFNATLYVMFVGWDWQVALRDTAWGVSWITLISLAYVYYLKKK